MYFFTDGYYDQIGGEHQKKFMKKNFRNSILKNSIHPMVFQKKQFLEDFELWKNDFFQIDDVTVVGLKI